MDISQAEKQSRTRLPEKSIRFPLAVHGKLVKLAEKLGRNQTEVFIQMVEYFSRTQKDPADINDELLKKTLARNHDAYTGFIKMQEKILLIPMHQNVEKMIRNQEQIVKFFNEQVLNANNTLLKNQEAQAAKSSETDKLLKLIYEQMQSRKKLKEQFLAILDNYIRARESIGSFKAREKEDLVETAKRQVADL